MVAEKSFYRIIMEAKEAYVVTSKVSTAAGFRRGLFPP